MNQDFTVQKKQYLTEKKIRADGVHLKKKFLHKQWAKKKFVQAENSPPPPPPHHFSNGPSLSPMGYSHICGARKGMAFKRLHPKHHFCVPADRVPFIFSAIKFNWVNA